MTEPYVVNVSVSDAADPVVDVALIDSVEEILVTVNNLKGDTGPPGADGDVGSGTTIEVVDAMIATHNQAEVVHAQASSGRDFAALFQNGLI